MKGQFKLLMWLLMFPLVFASAHAHEILVETQDGEIFMFDVNPNETFSELEEHVSALLDGRKEDFRIEVPSEGSLTIQAAHAQGGYLGYPRSYTLDVLPEEKSDIHYIVTSLANKSIISIAFIKGDLEDAGDRIDHLHPLRFLMTVFTDEELKVGIRNIRGKGWVWSHFTGGLKECLSTEASIGNIREEYVRHFAQTVGIDENLILPSIRSCDWDELIDLLITHIPRKGDHDRYDC